MCLLLGFGINQLYAQLPPAPDNKTGNGAVPYSWTWDGYWQPIKCNGFVDNLVGIVTIHWVVKFKNGLPVCANEHIFGTVYSTETPEVFTLAEKDKLVYSGLDMSFVHWHFNLIGNMGSHYIGAMTWDILGSGEMWFDKLICVGK